MKANPPPTTLEAAQGAHQEARAAYDALRGEVPTRGPLSPEAQVKLAQAAAAVAIAQADEVRVRLATTWEAWSPPFAKHIEGAWTRRTFDGDGMPEEQRVKIVCTVCKAEWRGCCTSGRVKDHVQRFAQVHLHRDPLTGAQK